MQAFRRPNGLITMNEQREIWKFLLYVTENKKMFHFGSIKFKISEFHFIVCHFAFNTYKHLCIAEVYSYTGIRKPKLSPAILTRYTTSLGLRRSLYTCTYGMIRKLISITSISKEGSCCTSETKRKKFVNLSTRMYVCSLRHFLSLITMRL